MKASTKLNRKNCRVGAIARSRANSDRPLYVLIRTLRRSKQRDEQPWRIWKRVSTRQEAIKAVAEHQLDPQNASQYQYRLA